MTKERELLRRALELLERDDDEQIEFCCIRDDIRAHLAPEEGKQEEEPVAWAMLDPLGNLFLLLRNHNISLTIEERNAGYSIQPLFLHPSPQAEQRNPLPENEIDSLFNCDETNPEYEHGFRDGIWFAEKHHGIGVGDE